MAETTKRKAGRPKKTTEEPNVEIEEIVEEVKEEASVEKQDNTDALKEAMELIAKMQEELAILKEEKSQPVSTVLQTSSPTSRKVKCVSIAHHPVNVSTQAKMNGKVFKFAKYGQVIQMKYDELLDVLASYPNTMASGLIYICDRDIIEDNGLEEAYENIYSKDIMDKIVYLREESDAHLINLKESTIVKVVQLYKDGEKMDATALMVLRDNGIDIVELAKEAMVS